MRTSKYQTLIHENDKVYKLCNLCEERKEVFEFNKDKRSSTGCTSECKMCKKTSDEARINNMSQEDKEKYMQKMRNHKKQWKLNNPDKNREINRRSALRRYYRYKKDELWIERLNARSRATAVRNREMLTDTYIKKSLGLGIPHSEIPQYLVELQRKNLILHRQLKN